MSTAPSPALRLVQPAVPDQGTALRLAGEALVRLGEVIVALGSRPEPPAPAPPAGPVHWIKPEDAAAIAGLDLSTAEARRRARVRIYSWARGKPWATRPNARTLLVDELRFRRWLGAHREKPEVVS